MNTNETTIRPLNRQQKQQIRAWYELQAVPSYVERHQRNKPLRQFIDELAATLDAMEQAGHVRA